MLIIVIRQYQEQQENATFSAKKYPGKVFYGPTFLFDTAGWGTEAGAKKLFHSLNKDISDGAVTVKIWKNIGMTVRDRSGKFIMVDDPGLRSGY